MIFIDIKDIKSSIKLSEKVFETYLSKKVIPFLNKKVAGATEAYSKNKIPLSHLGMQ